MTPEPPHDPKYSLHNTFEHGLALTLFKKYNDGIVAYPDASTNSVQVHTGDGLLSGACEQQARTNPRIVVNYWQFKSNFRGHKKSVKKTNLHDANAKFVNNSRPSTAKKRDHLRKQVTQRNL